MKKLFMALTLLAAVAYTSNSQAFFGLFGNCNTCCETCPEEVVVERVEVIPTCDVCA